MRKAFANPYLLLTLAALFWSGNMVVGRGVHEAVPPFALAFWRWVIALACVAPLALPHLRTQWPLVKKHWKALVVLGLLGVGGFNTLVYIGLHSTTATNAAILNSVIPIMTIALAFALLGRRLGGMEAVGVAVSLAGVGMIVARGDLATLLTLTLNRGDLWLLAAVLVWGLYTVGLHWRPPIRPMLLFAICAVVGLIALTPFYVWELASGQAIAMSGPALMAIAYVGIFPGFLGHVFYNAGVAAVGPNQGSLFIHLMPVFGTLLAATFLGERPYWFHFAGMALILSGIFLTTRYRRV
ncbi:MAG: DMT family transporter [Pseudazoarcus pumilus]|mgnify:CR=1 FL=1|nr:DMT family transporter [Pseudazoarcus pumilus]